MSITLSVEQVPGGLGCPGSGGVGRDPSGVHPPGVDLDDEQDVEPTQQRGVDTGEVGGDDRLCLGADELHPAGPGSIANRVDARCAEDLPDARRGDRVTEADHFAVDTTVSPRRVLPGYPDDQPAELRIDGRPPGACGPGVGSSVGRRGVGAIRSPWRVSRSGTPRRDDAGRRPQPARRAIWRCGTNTW